MKRYILALAIFNLTGCTQSGSLSNTALVDGLPSGPHIHDLAVGQWDNTHTDNSELAGVIVQQFPDNSHDAPKYESKHPCIILFVMWDGRVNELQYKPSGKITSNSWWHIKAESYIWKQLDFSVGSDPGFKVHNDPRTHS